jgi:membrane associated rhomboid family serine protease
MIFPIGDDQVKGGYRPFFSYLLLLLNIAVFAFQLSLPPGALQALIFDFGTIPREIVEGDDLYSLLTSMFLHGGWMHLIGNMLFLWVFADNIEAVAGNFSFLIFYLLGGLFASAAHIFFNAASTVPAIGASGAISAVLGAYLVMFPSSRIKVLLLFFFITFQVPAILFLGFWIVQQLMNGMAALDLESASTSGVAWWAHIGGFAFGIAYGFYMRNRSRSRSDKVYFP